MKIKPRTMNQTNRSGRGADRISNVHKRERAAVAAKRDVMLDYPREGEVISSTEYAFRVGAPEGAAGVEVSINNGPWHGCRKASGFWWYDWSQYRSGGYKAVARIRPQSGKDTATESRNFLVVLED